MKLTPTLQGFIEITLKYLYSMLGKIAELRVEIWSFSYKMVLVIKVIGWSSEAIGCSIFFIKNIHLLDKVERYLTKNEQKINVNTKYYRQF